MLLSFALGEKKVESALCALRVGVARATGCSPPKEGVQPNEGEGVKVGSTCVQSSNSFTISPLGRWVNRTGCYSRGKHPAIGSAVRKSGFLLAFSASLRQVVWSRRSGFCSLGGFRLTGQKPRSAV